MATTLTFSQILFVLATGLLPSLIWLFFWHQLDRDRPEPIGLVTVCFVMGAASVFIAIVLQQLTKNAIADPTSRLIVWAAIEEILKFFVFYIVAFKSKYDEEAIDPALYLIAVALGFAALENILYALQPIASFNITAGLLTGGFRFFGATLLHAIASCFIGLVITLTPKKYRLLAIPAGIAGAIFLHSTFNLYIIKNSTASFLQIYGYLWVTAIISHVILEKLRRFPSNKPVSVQTL